MRHSTERERMFAQDADVGENEPSRKSFRSLSFLSLRNETGTRQELTGSNVTFAEHRQSPVNKQRGMMTNTNGFSLQKSPSQSLGQSLINSGLQRKMKVNFSRNESASRQMYSNK